MTGATSSVFHATMSALASEVKATDEALRLFEAHGAPLFRFARLMLRSQADAEDVVQTAFVRLLDHLARDGSRSNLRAWLFAVAANLCRDQLRARKRWLSWLPEHEQRMTTPPHLEPGDPFALFMKTLESLAPRDRVLLALKAQGLSYREIAAAAGLRETSVGRLLARAFARWQRVRAASSRT